MCLAGEFGDIWFLIFFKHVVCQLDFLEELADVVHILLFMEFLLQFLFILTKSTEKENDENKF